MTHMALILASKAMGINNYNDVREEQFLKALQFLQVFLLRFTMKR